jgi:hypothetical protein
MPADVGIGDNGAALAKLELRTFPAKLGQQPAADFDGVAAVSEMNSHQTHARRIRAGESHQNKKALGSMGWILCRIFQNGFKVVHLKRMAMIYTFYLQRR